MENVIDFKILDDAKSAIYNKKSIELNYRIKNTDRTIGAIISNEISNLHGPDGHQKYSGIKFLWNQVKALDALPLRVY